MLSIIMAGVLYMDIGLSANLETDVYYQNDTQTKYHKWPNPLGEVEIGYTVKDKYTVFFSHKSSMEASDAGMNEVGIKARVFEW